jgi:photosystem II stability/assembly factor-like uncharacterized protein
VVSQRRPAFILAGLLLASACGSGSTSRSAGTESTTTTTAAPATTSSTAAPAGCPALRPAAEPAPPPNLDDLQMVNPTKGFAVGKGTILGTDDGKTWTPRYSGGASFLSVDAVDGVHAWAVGDRALYATVDGGKKWAGVGSPDDGTVLRQVHFVDEHFGWGVGRNGKLYRSGDGGHTWGDLEPPCGAEKVCFTAQEDGWVGAGNRIARSTNGGDTWTAVFAAPGDAEVNGWHPQDLQCARGGVVWALFAGNNAAAGHAPYAVYRGTATGQWTLVAKEPMTGRALPAAPALGGYPAPISVLSADAAVLLTWTGPVDPPVGLKLASDAGRTLGPQHNIPGLSSPAAASFTSAPTGWVVGTKQPGPGGNPADAILATTDGGATWQEQFTRPAPK